MHRGLAAIGQHEGDRAAELRTEPVVGGVAELGEHELEVRDVALPAGPPGGEHARHPVERVDAQSAVVGHGRHARRRADGARLQQGVALERRLGLGHLRHVGEGRDADDLDVQTGLGEDPVHLLDLVGVARREDDPGHGRLGHDWPSAAACRRVSSAQPDAASARSSSSSARSNGCPSAVPWTSM